MQIEAKETTAAFTADGTTLGVVTIADTTPFYKGAEAFLINTAGSAKRCKIMKITDATHLEVLLIPDDIGHDASGNFASTAASWIGYGRSDISTYTVASGAKISQPAQLVRVEPTVQKPF